MALLLRMAHVFFSVPTGWEKKKNKIPHRLPLKEQSITLRDFMNPWILPWILFFFSGTLMRVTLAGNVHTYIFILLFLSEFPFFLWRASNLLSIVGFSFFLPTRIHGNNKLNMWINSILSGAEFRFLLNGSQDVGQSEAKMFVTTEVEVQTRQTYKNTTDSCLCEYLSLGRSWCLPL